MVKVKPQQLSGARLYGGARPSVTTVLQLLDDHRWLNSWRNRVGRVEADKTTEIAQAIGTRVHKMAERIAQGKDEEPPEGCEHFATAIRGFLESQVAEVLDTELVMDSLVLGYGGTVDLYARLKDGSLAVIDWKTSSSLDRKHGLQCAAYGLLLRETGRDVNRRLVVRLKKEKGAEGKFAVREFKDNKADVEAWKACLALWYWKNGARLAKARDKRAG